MEKNYSREFKDFYLNVILPNIPSYNATYNASNFDKNIDITSDLYEKSYGKSLFVGSDAESLFNILNLDKTEANSEFKSYSDKKGSGVPAAVINHYLLFLQFVDKQIEFESLQELITKIHDKINTVGKDKNFISTFRTFRKEITGQSKVVKGHLLFGDVRDNYWSINVGAEKELQYHINISEGKNIKYGIGFNIQGSSNNHDPVKNVQPFKNSFYANRLEVDKILKDYTFLDDDEYNLMEVNYGSFILYGQLLPIITEDSGKFSIGGLSFLKLLYDLKYKQYRAFCKIFEGSTISEEILIKSIQMNKKIEILEYKKQIILQGPPGTGKTREAELIAKEMLGLSDIKELENNDQYKLVQFHPSYTYEDFVRGISAIPSEDGKGVLYKAENKILSLFAQEAYKNYEQSTKTESQILYKDWIDDQFDNFIDTVQASIDNSGEYRLTDKVKLFDLDDSSFYYTGDSWFGEPKHRMKFSDIKEGFINNVLDAKSFKALPNTSGSAKQHYGYYYKVLSDFQNSVKTEFKNENKSLSEPKKYVLVIDEINRANLSSVLGELIYALEYREKTVDSMYSVEDSVLDNKNQIILPPNLYIIGTMNTADRSVGHIDYAIRRRFAFVEVLPKPLVEDEEIYFNIDGYNLVADLFSAENVSPEFEIQDVQIGHSYFIAKKSEAKNETERDEIFTMKMKYEVLPILEEYVKDGILVGKVGEFSIKNYIKSLKK